MYQSGLGLTLPKALTPPSWLRNIVGSAFKGTTVSVPTPSGTLTVDISDPAQLQMLKNMVLGAKIGKASPGGGPSGGAAAAAGVGIGTIALVVLGAMFLLGRRSRA